MVDHGRERIGFEFKCGLSATKKDFSTLKPSIRTILNKKYFPEMDFLRLQKALLICRMSANSTFLVDKRPPGYSSKLDELEALLESLPRNRHSG